MIETLWRRLLHVILRGRTTAPVDDSKPTQTVQGRLSAFQLTDNIPRLVEFGFSSAPPAGADFVAVCLGGNPTDIAIVATGHQSYRVRNLGDGDAVVYDSRGRTIHLSATGIAIDGGADPVTVTTTGDVTINAANLRVNGNTIFTGTVTANGHRIDETHKHSGVSIGAANTGTVT